MRLGRGTILQGSLREVRVVPYRERVEQFLSKVKEWAADEPNVLGVALGGSHVRNQATESSDVDLIVIAREPQAYLQTTHWAQQFGVVARQQFENYGRVTSLRVWYSFGCEAEFAITDETWTRLPLDGGTRRVISDGMKIIFERGSILSQVIEAGRDVPRGSS